MDDARAEYLRSVEEAFITLRGRGLMLSARDVALVERWRTDGVPLRIVLRGLDEGAQSFKKRNGEGAAVPSSLVYFESQIDTAATQWRERMMAWWDVSPGGTTVSSGGGRVALLEAAMAAVVEAGQAMDSVAIKEVLREVWRELRQSLDRDDEEPWTLIARLDGDMVRAVEASLDNETRVEMRAHAERRVREAGGARMSENAREARVQQLMASAVRERAGVPDLVQVVSDVGV